MKRFIILLPFLVFSSLIHLHAQEVKLDVVDRPLNEVLVNMAGSNELEISFDDLALSKYRITLIETFAAPELAIRRLISGLPLAFEKNGDVFVIFPAIKKVDIAANTISGQVLDKTTLEPLPFTNVIINQNGVAADFKGSFTYTSFDSMYSIRVSHLGYFMLDTVANEGSSFEFLLSPSVIGLREIEIKNSVISRSALIGERAGQMKLNHQVANFLPGFGDNSVFNLLRLQPGILASGEQTNELIIWGCYEGHSKIMFDGFTIYSLKNFNDNISSFNPLMAKDIEVYKGGYDARYGDRVGGIVNVTGINGNRIKPSFTVNANNMTLNSLAEIPIRRKSSLVVSLRTTYYELYNPAGINDRLRRNNDRDTTNDVDITIIPDYRFRDINIKYSATFREQDLFYVSLYGGNDQFSYLAEVPLTNVNVIKDTREENIQSGGAIFYGRVWNHGSSTNFTINFSGLKSAITDKLTIVGHGNGFKDERLDEHSENVIRESTVQADHRVSLGPAHILEGGMVWKRNLVELHEDTFNIVQAHLHDTAQLLTLFMQDNMTLGKRMSLKAGIRINQSVTLKRFYLEPRLSVSFDAGKHWKLNAAWGIYNQFIAKSSAVDDLGNFRYIWTACDNEDIPVLTSKHYVAGVSYAHHDLTFSMEGYFKGTKGLTRFVRNNYYHVEGIFSGKGRSYGIDVMVKKNYHGHSAWLSYSLSRTEELFEYFLAQDYRRAPQDQRHEVKAALLLNFDPFYFSADYVFGSGFPSPAYLAQQEPDDLTYSRMDVAFIYKFLDRKLKGEIGLSVMNVLNTKNIKYSNFERIPTEQTNSINIYAEAIPITPALYLKLAL